MDLAPLLYVVRATERLFLFLVYGLLLTIPVIFTVPAISMIFVIGCVDLPIVLPLLCGPLAMWFKEPSLGLRGLDAYIRDHEQIDHRLGLLHSDLFNNLEIADPVMEGINDLDILDIRDSIPGAAKIFHVISEAFIMLLLDGLEVFCCRWTLICTLEIPDEHGTQLVPVVDGSFRQIDEPRSSHTR
jgi:hypothetical protein